MHIYLIVVETGDNDDDKEGINNKISKIIIFIKAQRIKWLKQIWRSEIEFW